MKRRVRILAMMLIGGAVSAAGAQPPVSVVYQANCSPCHGKAGDANTPAGKNFKAPSFRSEAVLNQSDASLLAIVMNGKGRMPAWHDRLSEEQLKELIAFIHTLQNR